MNVAQRIPLHRSRRGWAALALVTLLAGLLPAGRADAQALQVTPLSAERVSVARSSTGRLAQTDPTLMGVQDPAPVRVAVKLDYDAVASYRGDVEGLAPTSPSVTGEALDAETPAVEAYTEYVEEFTDDVLDAVAAEVPQADVGRSLQTVYGGFTAEVPGDQVADLLAIDGVAAVQRDELRQTLTDASPDFIGAPAVYDQLGLDGTAGQGVIVGVLDSGAWPEHPSFAETVDLPAPPPLVSETGTVIPRTCDFGDNPLTPEADEFVCNNKLISGQAFIETYSEVIGGEPYPDSARDGNGHGTHTATTAAGGPVETATVFGVGRGPLQGIAPGAHVAVYRVCGGVICVSSDAASAVEQAILDGVDVINYSISGGTAPYSDVVSLAFLDAYAAGVFVAAAAGNDGPEVATANHLEPWVTTVAASTQTRAFEGTATLTGGGETLTVTGASITGGIETSTPVVLAAGTPGYEDGPCAEEAAPGTFEGEIVVCERGVVGRVLKGYNVAQGGAVGMLLYNPEGVTDIETDNHWLPTVHLNVEEGQALLAFLTEHPDASATTTPGALATDQGDVMASFSSRGPGADVLKPDVTAPGVQILAGHTPTPDTVDTGPPGELFQALQGTSMSSPHVAGSAALLAALHPDFTPGQIKSALMTTATQDVVKEDFTTPADPFDFGSGRIDLTVAGNPGLTFDEGAGAYLDSREDELNRVDLNLPSVNLPTLPGVVTTTRSATNVTDEVLSYTVETSAPADVAVTVSPSGFVIAPGETVTMTITIHATFAEPGQYFGELRLLGGPTDLHLPLALNRGQTDLTLDTTCDPDRIRLLRTADCTVTAQNDTLETVTASLAAEVSDELIVASGSGGERVGLRRVELNDQVLTGRSLASPTIAPGDSPGYVSLADIPGEPGSDPPAAMTVGDETLLTLEGLPEFTFADETYTEMGVTSNGYLVVGPAEAADVVFEPQDLPDPERPNNVLAPFWTDLSGEHAPGIFAALASGDDGTQYIVIEWQLRLLGDTGAGQVKVFQAWIGVNGEGDDATEDITFAYDPANLPTAPPASYGLTVGVENIAGSAGDQIDGPPTEDYRVTSTPGTPGASVTLPVRVRGVQPGLGQVVGELTSPSVRGITTDAESVRVRPWR